MSIGNQKFGIPRKYKTKSVFGISVPNFLVFYRNFVNVLVKIWLNSGIWGQNKIGLVYGFFVCHFIGIGLVSVCHFPENDISSVVTDGPLPAASRKEDSNKGGTSYRVNVTELYRGVTFQV